MLSPVRADPPGTVPQNSETAGVVSAFFEHLARYGGPVQSTLIFMPSFNDMLQPGARDPQGLPALLYGIGAFAGQADRNFTIASLAFAQASICIARKADTLKGAERNNVIAASLVTAIMAGMSQPRGKSGKPLSSTCEMVNGLFAPLLEMSAASGRPLIEACRTASGMRCTRTEHQQLHYYGHVANRAAKALGVMTKSLG